MIPHPSRYHVFLGLTERHLVPSVPDSEPSLAYLVPTYSAGELKKGTSDWSSPGCELEPNQLKCLKINLKPEIKNTVHVIIKYRFKINKNYLTIANKLMDKIREQSFRY